MTDKSNARKAGSYREARRQFERELTAAVRAARDTLGEKMMARAWRTTMSEIDGAGSKSVYR